MSFEIRPVEKQVKTRHSHGPALARVADHVARGDRPFIIHERYGYQTTNTFPKIRFEFDVNESCTWPMRDRVDQNLAGYEVCVRSLSAESEFQLEIQSFDTLLASSPNQDMHVLDFGLGGLLLSQVSVGQRIKFANLAEGATVHVIAEIYPSRFLYTDVVRATGASGVSVADVQRLYVGCDGTCTEPRLNILFRGIEHYYQGGMYMDRVDPGRVFPTFYEFTPVVTNDNKAQLAEMCPMLDAAEVADLPVNVFANVLQAMRTKEELPDRYFVLQQVKQKKMKTEAMSESASTQSKEGGAEDGAASAEDGGGGEEGPQTLDAKNTHVFSFSTTNQGVKYAQRALVKLGTSVELTSTDILQQIQSFTPFSVFTGVNGNVEIKSKPMGHLSVVTFARGLPINSYNRCFVHFSDVFPSLVYGVPDAEFRVVRDDGAESVVKRTKDPEKATAELSRLGELYGRERVVIRSPVTFVCEVIGEEHLETLMHLNVLALSPQHVIVEQVTPPAAAIDPEQ